MNETPMTPAEPKKSNTGLIIGVVVAVVLCCCCLLAVLGWFYGDAIISNMNF
jgi:hypothetical protein